MSRIYLHIYIYNLIIYSPEYYPCHGRLLGGGSIKGVVCGAPRDTSDISSDPARLSAGLPLVSWECRNGKENGNYYNGFRV